MTSWWEPDPYTPAERAFLEARWKVAGVELDTARRCVEVGAGTLFALLPDRLDDRDDLVATVVEGWVRATLTELRALGAENELPVGGVR